MKAVFRFMLGLIPMALLFILLCCYNIQLNQLSSDDKLDKLDMPPCCAACPADMYADHALRLAQEVVTENFFLRLLRQKGKGGGKFRMV